MKKLTLVEANYDPKYAGRDGRGLKPPVFVWLEVDGYGLVVDNDDNERTLDDAFGSVKVWR